MNAHHDHDDFARMIAAQANLRARLIAQRLALPNPFRLRACRPPWLAEDGDEAGCEVVWLETAAECSGRTPEVFAVGRADDAVLPARGEALTIPARRRCA
jgi:hypothetical protein